MEKQSDRMVRQLTALEDMFDEAIAEKDTQRAGQLGRTIQSFHKDLEKLRVREESYVSVEHLAEWRVAFLDNMTKAIRKHVADDVWFAIVDELAKAGFAELRQLDRAAVEEIIESTAKRHFTDEDAKSFFVDEVMSNIDEHTKGKR